LLSTPNQLDAIECLRGALLGHPSAVIGLLVGLRVRLETVELDDSALQAVDRLAAEWEDKTAAARRRRWRRLRERAAQHTEAAQEIPREGDSRPKTVASHPEARQARSGREASRTSMSELIVHLAPQG
jgi:hypothetical protein